ncbi:acyl-CoA dehydrogenase family protein [Streptomyces iconiensis]|uniref:Acyl-CoA dehydrogenase family protein n=1 Tax=Streptomyces iconiensis TaxID=1384038 RepID=A0ABT7ABV6_9ACTN|nr:acyl-CoA dehydrogenase family protein [Streptomyces iconiensis]MDJ1138118.1 acyl-CoA dehydrogenase family protein [Streptomyces iconiensis]
MRFLPDEDHRTYAATVRRLLADAEPAKAARAWAAGDQGPGRELWRALADTGLPALAVPEERGGMGWYPSELAAAFVEIGRAAAPGPLVETVALAAALGADPRGGDTAGPWLPRILTGDLLVTVTDPAGPYAVDGYLADAAFVTEGPALHMAVPEGGPLPSIDPTRHLVRCEPATPVESGEPVPGDAARLRSLATLLTAAQALGAGRALLDGSVEYAGRRTQFGRQIGSFQAVKHQLATVAIALEFAEPLLHGAALAVRAQPGGPGPAEGSAGGPGDATDPRDLPAAKAACSRAAHQAARTALQVHGALGYTDEYDLTLHLRKARALHDAWGTPAACHQAVLAGGRFPAVQGEAASGE